MADDTLLLEVLQSMRERGALGETSLVAAIQHADCFVPALPPSTRRLIDLGSGGGLPGLVLVMRLPDVEIVLTDRRERRMDLLRRACSRLGVADRVTVVTADVVRLATSAEFAGTFDAVTARAFGAPMVTLRCAVPFLGDAGVVVISEPPAREESGVPSATPVRWPIADVAELGMVMCDQHFDRVQRFDRMRS